MTQPTRQPRFGQGPRLKLALRLEDGRDQGYVQITNCLPGEELECDIRDPHGVSVWSGRLTAQAAGWVNMGLTLGDGHGYRFHVRSLRNGDRTSMSLDRRP